MKKVIDRKVYDTETAEEIAHWCNGYEYSDFHSCEEVLYRTKNGAWFIWGSGGPMSPYAVKRGNETWGSSDIRAVTQEEAYAWCEEHNCHKAIETHFADLVTEA